MQQHEETTQSTFAFQPTVVSAASAKIQVCFHGVLRCPRNDCHPLAQSVQWGSALWWPHLLWDSLPSAFVVRTEYCTPSTSMKDVLFKAPAVRSKSDPAFKICMALFAVRGSHCDKTSTLPLPLHSALFSSPLFSPLFSSLLLPSSSLFCSSSFTAPLPALKS